MKNNKKQGTHFRISKRNKAKIANNKIKLNKQTNKAYQHHVYAQLTSLNNELNTQHKNEKHQTKQNKGASFKL